MYTRENLDREGGIEASQGIWHRRYREINDWERYLTDNGIRLVKLFLNVSKEEQRVRFLKRIDLPEKNWKFSAADAMERRHWDEYQVAYSADAHPHQHRVGSLARPSRPTTSGSPGSAPPRSSPAR